MLIEQTLFDFMAIPSRRIAVIVHFFILRTLCQKSFEMSSEKKSSGLIPPSPTINAS